VQRVRRHRPSELLPAVARTALRFKEKGDWVRDRIRWPWALATIAKVTIVHGNEHRASGVTDRDVVEICAAYNAIADPLGESDDDVVASLAAFMVRAAHEQFSAQLSLWEEITRFNALLADLGGLPLKIINDDLVGKLLGCALGDFTSTGFALWVGAEANAGYFDPDWPALRGLEPHITVPRIQKVFEDHFLTDFDAVKIAAKEREQDNPLLRKHEFNPLEGRPFVIMPDGRYLAPQPRYIIQKLSPPRCITQVSTASRDHRGGPLPRTSE